MILRILPGAGCRSSLEAIGLVRSDCIPVTISISNSSSCERFRRRIGELAEADRRTGARFLMAIRLWSVWVWGRVRRWVGAKILMELGSQLTLVANRRS